MGPFLPQLEDCFQIASTNFLPFSRWFSYGSNLSPSDFRKKMAFYLSDLTLIRPQVALLRGYERSLSNKSNAHGLAYTVKPCDSTITTGVVHQVPIGQLDPYLQMEGVVKDGKLRTDRDRKYDLRTVTVTLHGSKEEEVLTLIGRIPGTIAEVSTDQYIKLQHYVETSLRGARHFGIDSSGFESDRELVRKIREESEQSST